MVELNRRFLLGYKYFEKDPRLVDLAQRIKAYNNTLKYFGLRDYQVARTQTTMYSAAPVLVSRIIKLVFLAIFGFPSLVKLHKQTNIQSNNFNFCRILINSPLIILTLVISQKKQEGKCRFIYVTERVTHHMIFKYK